MDWRRAPRERIKTGACSSLQFEQTLRVAEVDLALVAFGQAELLDRADAFADEHRAAFRIEWAVACEHDLVDAEEGNATSERRGGAAEHRVAIEHLEVLDRRFAQPFEDLGFIALRRASAQLRPERLRTSGKVRDHPPAMVRDDAQLGQLLQQAAEHPARHR